MNIGTLNHLSQDVARSQHTSEVCLCPFPIKVGDFKPVEQDFNVSLFAISQETALKEKFDLIGILGFKQSPNIVHDHATNTSRRTRAQEDTDVFQSDS